MEAEPPKAPASGQNTRGQRRDRPRWFFTEHTASGHGTSARKQRRKPAQVVGTDLETMLFWLLPVLWRRRDGILLGAQTLAEAQGNGKKRSDPR
jgi:hypothetical protein